MSRFVLEEPYALARFHSTIASEDISTHFVVSLRPLEESLTTSTKNEADHVESDQVALTVQGEGVKLYNTADQKCTKSWTTPPGVVFVGPAIHRGGNQDENLDHVYAIVASGPDIAKNEEKRTIWLWRDAKINEGDLGLGQRISKTFENTIQSIHATPAIPSHIILVHGNGAMSLVTNDLQKLSASQKASSKGHIFWSSVFVTPRAHSRPCCIPNTVTPPSSAVIIAVLRTERPNRYTVILSSATEDGKSITSIAQVDMQLEDKLIAVTFDPMDGLISTLDASGTWTVWQLSISDNASSVKASLTSRFTRHWQGYQFFDDSLGNVAAMAPLANSYVAIVAPRIKKNNEGSDYVVSVWDLKYGTLQAEQWVHPPEKNTPAGKKIICNIVTLSNSHLAITMSTVDFKKEKKGGKSKATIDAKSVVMLCPFYSEPMSLMAALGKMKGTAKFLDAHDIDVQSDKTVGLTHSGWDAVAAVPMTSNNDDKFYKKWLLDLKQNQTEEEDIISKLTDSELSGEKFSCIFLSYISPALWSQKQRLGLDDGGEANGTDMDVDHLTVNNQIDQTSGLNVLFQQKVEIIKQELRPSSSQLTKKDVSHHFLSTITRRCFREKDGKPDASFLPLDTLAYLIATSNLHNSYIEEGLVKVLLKREAWGLLPVVIAHVDDIPETDIILLIKELVRMRLEDPKEWDTRFMDYMKIILRTPRNTIFLQQAMKQITASELPLIVSAIIASIELYTVQDDKIAQPEITAYHKNVLDFANTLLDIHFPTIILEPTFYDMVTKLREIIDREIGIVDELEDLRGILGPFKRKQMIFAMEHAAGKAAESEEAPQDELHRYRKLNRGKFGGEQGVPVYRVEVFRFNH
ncbi:uncharacterized protein BYT42DRAFT_585183 [Radiomyces spectabilis]|uniref:uncharacterized protein n=1 Tax=Radiomyces spectabilis TaxID=64574 RepID=UPI0022208E45|nr:uncharacterized protein BYT42DRAFT_585183 [Radiomyces spectabilis]KAI8369639.1 hypothetical protein BYT42DRAFT_585183 [Radiomyces spectabilis]